MTAAERAEKRIAIVTGGNRGLGEGIAKELAARGLEVIPTSREPRDGHEPLDVEKPESLAAFVRAVTARAPRGVDVLVNNAGASFDGFDAKIAERTLAVNFYGPMHLTDALLPSMRPGGRLVMVSSGMGKLARLSAPLRARFSDAALTRAGLLDLMTSFVRDVAAGTHERQGWPSNAYTVSKIGLNALVRIYARELAQAGDDRALLVNSADPGWVRTRMGGRGAPSSVEQGAKTPVFLALLPEGGPTGGFFADERPTPW